MEQGQDAKYTVKKRVRKQRRESKCESSKQERIASPHGAHRQAAPVGDSRLCDDTVDVPEAGVA